MNRAAAVRGRAAPASPRRSCRWGPAPCCRRRRRRLVALARAGDPHVAKRGLGHVAARAEPLAAHRDLAEAGRAGPRVRVEARTRAEPHARRRRGVAGRVGDLHRGEHGLRGVAAHHPHREPRVIFFRGRCARDRCSPRAPDTSGASRPCSPSRCRPRARRRSSSTRTPRARGAPGGGCAYRSRRRRARPARRRTTRAARSARARGPCRRPWSSRSCRALPHHHRHTPPRPRRARERARTSASWPRSLRSSGRHAGVSLPPSLSTRPRNPLRS